MASAIEMSQRFLNSPQVDTLTKNTIKSMDTLSLHTAFSSFLSFGTAGLRAKMQPGIAFMNTYTVAHAAAGLAKLICSQGAAAMERGVVIAYDSREHSKEFARRSAQVLSAFHIKTYLFEQLRPTPVLSFAVRRLSCIAGINITASHNPKEYNGFKVYWEDGAQIGPQQADAISAEMENLDILEDVPGPDAAEPERILPVPAEVDEAYIQCVLGERVNQQAIPAVCDTFHVIYTPLHGAGITMVPQVLKKAGLTNLHIVPEQEKPDGTFPTVIHPNPEAKEAFTLGRQMAETVGSDLIIATDPDSDRVGAMARDADGAFQCITGNQMGALLLDYIITAYLQKGSMPPSPYVVKSIVTTNLAREICRRNGVQIYEVLTGFKYIGEVVKEQLEIGGSTFLLGFEESYGYLKGTYTRDKDAVVASLLICEMAAYYKSHGKTLCDALEDLFAKYGFYQEKTLDFYFDMPGGQERIAGMMEGLRSNPPSMLAKDPVTVLRDYQAGKIYHKITGEIIPTGLPISDILYFSTEHCDTIIRPSGTEPKLKIYLLACSTDKKTSKSILDVYEAAIRAVMDI